MIFFKKYKASLAKHLTDFRGRICQHPSVRKVLDGKVVAICRAHPVLVYILLLLIYRLLFDVLYMKVIAPMYGYRGIIAQLHPVRYGASLLAVLLFAPAVVWLQRQKNASSIILTVINYIYFIPLTTYYGCSGTAVTFFIIAVIYWALLLFLQAKIPILIAKPFPVKQTKWLFPALTLGASALIMFISGKYTGFRLVFDVINVYGIRAEAATYQIPTLFSYALAMMPCVLTVLILYWLKQKKYWVAGLLCIVFLFLFSIAAHKSIFFMLVLCIGCWFIFRPWMVRWIGGLASLGIIAGFAEYILRGVSYIVSIFYFRLGILPIQIGSQYADYFENNPLNLFRDGILGKLSFESIYSAPLPRIIGEFRNFFSENANNGLLGDMYANLPPILGVLLMPLTIIIILRILDMVSDNIDRKLLFPFCMFYAISFTNLTWSTVLFSGGFLLLCLLIYIFPKEEKNIL